MPGLPGRHSLILSESYRSSLSDFDQRIIVLAALHVRSQITTNTTRSLFRLADSLPCHVLPEGLMGSAGYNFRKCQRMGSGRMECGALLVRARDRCEQCWNRFDEIEYFREPNHTTVPMLLARKRPCSRLGRLFAQINKRSSR